jgi:hypothetical protein
MAPSKDQRHIRMLATSPQEQEVLVFTVPLLPGRPPTPGARQGAGWRQLARAAQNLGGGALQGFFVALHLSHEGNMGGSERNFEKQGPQQQ